MLPFRTIMIFDISHLIFYISDVLHVWHVCHLGHFWHLTFDIFDICVSGNILAFHCFALLFIVLHRFSLTIQPWQSIFWQLTNAEAIVWQLSNGKSEMTTRQCERKVAFWRFLTFDFGAQEPGSRGPRNQESRFPERTRGRDGVAQPTATLSHNKNPF